MSEGNRLETELSKVNAELDALSDACKTEAKRRYMVLYETILSLHAVEQREAQFLEAKRKAAKTAQINSFIALAVILYLLWMKTDANEVVSYIIILGVVLSFGGVSIVSDISSDAKSNQFWFEMNRLKKELASLTSWSTVLTRDLIEIQSKYADENPNYEALSEKKIEWEIDAKKALIRNV